jgi:hypothetical protein
MKRFAFAATLVGIGTFASADALGALVEYQFTGSSLAPTSQSGGAGSDFAIGSGLTYTDGSNNTTVSGIDTAIGNPAAPSVKLIGFNSSNYATNVTNNDFASFTFDPTTTVDLESISFSVRPSSTGSTRNVRVSYSFDGFASSGIALPVMSIAGNSGWQTYSQPLTDEVPALNTTTSTITFRIEGDQGGNQSRFFNIDNIQVAGVPEPTALSALAFAGLALGGRRRR